MKYQFSHSNIKELFTRWYLKQELWPDFAVSNDIKGKIVEEEEKEGNNIIYQ